MADQGESFKGGLPLRSVYGCRLSRHGCRLPHQPGHQHGIILHWYVVAHTICFLKNLKEPALQTMRFARVNRPGSTDPNVALSQVHLRACRLEGVETRFWNWARLWFSLSGLFLCWRRYSTRRRQIPITGRHFNTGTKINNESFFLLQRGSYGKDLDAILKSLQNS